MNIQEIRQKYPQYDGISDDKLADSFYNKFYSGKMEREVFNNAIGLRKIPASSNNITSSNNNTIEPKGDFLKNIAKDFAGGVMGGAQRFGSALSELVEYPTHAAYEALSGNKVPHYNVRELWGLEGKNPVDLKKAISHDPNSFVSTAGQFAPAIAGGGTNIAKQAITNGLWGAVQANPEQENLGGILPSGRSGAAIQDAGTAAALGGALKYLPKIPQKIGNLVNYIRPNKDAAAFLKSLGSGTKEENVQALARDIDSAYQTKLQDALSHKTPVLKKEGGSNIYKSYIGKSPVKFKSKFSDLAYKNSGLIIGGTRDLFDKFKSNPTLKNADELQSQLHADMRYYSERAAKSGITKAEGAEQSKIKEMRDALKNEIESHLKRVNPYLAKEYATFSKKYRENVLPYQEEKATQRIANEPDYIKKQRKKNPELHYNVTGSEMKTAFAEPSREAMRISQDIGKSGRNKILYNLLADEANPEAAGLANAILNAKQAKGYSKYITPEMEDFAKKLLKRTKWRKRAKIGGGLLGTAILGAGAYDLSKKII